MNDELITKFSGIAKRVGRAMSGACHLSPDDAQQEALVGLTLCVQRYGKDTNGGMVAISVRNHLLSIAEKQNAAKRRGVTVHHDDIYPSSQPSAEQLCIAADTERVIGDACESMNMSSEQTLALSVVLHTLSSPKYKAWIESHPVEWSVWMNAADMLPERASEITPAKARKLFTRLMYTLKDAR